MSAFSFNLLPRSFRRSNNKNIVTINQECFVKPKETYFLKSGTIFSNIPKEVNLENLGLINTKNAIPGVLRIKKNKNSKLYPCAFKEAKHVNSAYLVCAKKREQELETLKIQERKLEYLDKNESLKEEYKNVLEEERMIKETEEESKNYFRQQWKDFELTGLYERFALL